MGRPGEAEVSGDATVARMGLVGGSRGAGGWAAMAWVVTLTCLVTTGLTPPAHGEETPLQEENARLQAENERLRAELDALRTESASASTEAMEAAEEAASPVPGDQMHPDSTGEETDAAIFEYVPRSRVTLSVTRDDSGSIRHVSTPWYRTVPDTDLLPLREFIQFRAIPGRGTRPEQVWLALNRQGVAAPLGSGVHADLQIDEWRTSASIVDQKTTRRRRAGRQNATPKRTDETTLFALPMGALQKLALSERASFDAGPVHFELSDELVAAAAAMAARLAKEESR